MQIKLSAKWTVQLAFGLGIATLIVMGGVSYRSVMNSRDSSRWVDHTHQVLERLQDMVFGMEAVSSSMRRFVITGQESDLDGYHAAKADIDRLGPELRRLTADNPYQQARIPILEKLADGRAARAETLVKLRRDQGIEAAMESVRKGPTRQVTAEYATVVRQMREEEVRLLAVREAGLQQQFNLTKIILLLGSALSLLVAGGAWWIARRARNMRERAEEALFAEKERAQVTLNSIGDGVVCTDLAGNLTFMNAVAETLTGWPCHEAAGRPMADVLQILNSVSRAAIPDPMAKALAQNQSDTLPPNCILVRRDATEIPIEDSVAPIRDRKGKPIGVVMVFRDVTLTLAMAQEIAHAAQHDFLTGLPNRRLLNDRIGVAIASAARRNNKLAILFLDLDGFKQINDTLGHSAGDMVLQWVAARLSNCVRPADTVSRQGGDEFVVLLDEVQQLSDVEATAMRMLQAVAETHSVNSSDLRVTTSIGVSIYPEDGLNAETLLKNADTAMYQAKQHGRQRIQFFTPGMAATVLLRHQPRRPAIAHAVGGS